jgi:hypothetical protein
MQESRCGATGFNDVRLDVVLLLRPTTNRAIVCALRHISYHHSRACHNLYRSLNVFTERHAPTGERTKNSHGPCMVWLQARLRPRESGYCVGDSCTQKRSIVGGRHEGREEGTSRCSGEVLESRSRTIYGISTCVLHDEYWSTASLRCERRC